MTTMSERGVGSVALRWSHVDLLVDLLELLSLLLGDVQPNREVIVVLNQTLNCTCAILKVCTESLALLSKLLHDVGDLNTVKGSLSQFLVFT